MNSSLKVTIGVIFIIPIYFSNNIKGYFLLKEYCESHPTFVINEKLDPNQGWQYGTDDYGTKTEDSSKSIIAEYLYFIPQIKYMRFTEHADDRSALIGKFIGSKRLPYKIFENKTYRSKEDDERESSTNYEFKTEDSTQKPTYLLEWFQEVVPYSMRLSRMGTRIVDLRTNEIAIEFSSVSYRIFDKEIYNYSTGCGIYQTFLKVSNHNQLFKDN